MGLASGAGCRQRTRDEEGHSLRQQGAMRDQEETEFLVGRLRRGSTDK